MRLVTGLLACVGLVAASCALADSPPAAAADVTPAVAPSTPAAPAAAAPAATPAAATTPAAAPASAAASAKPATESAGEVSERLEKHFKHEGYSVQTRNGEKVFCRSEASTGTRISRTNCYSEDALVRSENLGTGGISANCHMAAATGASSSGGACGQ